jgi:hypothetical protein
MLSKRGFSPTTRRATHQRHGAGFAVSESIRIGTFLSGRYRKSTFSLSTYVENELSRLSGNFRKASRGKEDDFESMPGAEERTPLAEKGTR